MSKLQKSQLKMQNALLTLCSVLMIASPLRADSGAKMSFVFIVPELRGEKTHTARPLVWHYPHDHGSEWTPGAAIRAGDWKLIEFSEFGDAELYSQKADPGEHMNFAELEPDRLHDLRQKWQENLHAKMPQPNSLWMAE